jgi:molybdopterin-guanine dinucleotide biosynthesis protein A
LPDPDSVRGQGQLAGLLAGLGAATAAGARAVLVCPCDTPGITPAVLASLLTAWQAQPDRPVIAEHRGRRHPLHGVYPVALAEALARRLRAGERRALGFAEAMAARPVICAAPEAVFRNLNRWRDLEPPGA